MTHCIKGKILIALVTLNLPEIFSVIAFEKKGARGLKDIDRLDGLKDVFLSKCEC